ncbi:hypothetical protein KY289_007434 [Solanum tuberosum]|nr:hypothetical protein KY289_007434 [Solanum tuberosum]
MIFNTVVHEGETLPLQCDDSFCEDVSLNTKVPTAMLHDTKESNTEKEYNLRDNVALFDKCPKRDTSEMCGGKQTGVPPYLDFSLHKCNWVDTGQECNLPSFLSSNSRGCGSEEKMEEVLQLYDWGCVGGVEIDVKSYGAFNTSFASYKLLGEFIENSFMCLYNGVTTVLVQFNAPVVQFDISAKMNLDILFFSLGHDTLLDWLARPGTDSLWDLPHSTPAVKSEEEDNGEAIGKKMIVSLVRKFEYYDAAILKIPTFIHVTTTVRQ